MRNLVVFVVCPQNVNENLYMIIEFLKNSK